MDKTEIITSEKYSKFIKRMAVCCFVFMVLFVIYGVFVSPDLKLFYETAKIYDGEWIRVYQDGVEKSYTMPMTLRLNEGDVATFYTVLPNNVDEGMYLSINTGKSFSMYVGGEEIYRFDNNISRLPGNITKTVIVPVPLKASYANRKLTMVITNDSYDRNTVNAAYIGSLMGIVILLAKNYALQLVMAILLSLASVTTICIFTHLGKRNNKKANLIYLAEGILAICLWIIFDSPLFQLVFGVYFFDGIAGFMLVIIMGLPFLLYFDAIMEYRNHLIFSIFETIVVINFVVLTFLHLTGIRSYDQSLVYMDIMLVCYILIIIVLTTRDYITRKDQRHRNVIVGMIGLSLFSFIEIVVTILYTLFPFKVDIGGLFVLLGMIILLFYAILDQIKAFEVLKNETQTAIAATKAKSDFLANMSHEIRTPINAIMGMNEMIMRESVQDNVKEYAKDIDSASENLLNIVNDILDFSKIESGKLELVCDNYDLGEMICDVASLVNMKAEDKGLKFNVRVDEQLPGVLYGDDKRVREIITNILNNAVKYTESGYVNLNVDGRTIDGTLWLNFSVEDSGQGIRAEDIDSIFDGFSQVNTKKNKNIEGTGLGLSITKRLVELMNGTIGVESEFGKGSVFSVSLPQRVVSYEKMGNYLSHRHASVKDKNQGILEVELPEARILVVDDTALNLKVISKLLSKTKATVSCASSGREMLDLIKENSYDIIFLDHMMPNMDGIETLKQSKMLKNNKCKDVPVIALTANAIVGAKEMYLEAGFDDYLSKPVRMNELCDTMVKFLPGKCIRT